MNTPDPRLTPHELEALGELSAAERALLEWSTTIDDAVAGRLPARELENFETAVARDAGLREAYEEARASHSLTSGLPIESCPPALSAAIAAAVDLESTVVGSASSRPLRTPAPRGRRETLLRAGGMLAAVVALLAILLPGRLLLRSSDTPRNSFASSGYSDTEVRTALLEMQTALAMISGAMDGTAEVLRSEMQSEVSDRMQKPLEEGLRRSVRPIPYLNPDTGNDQHSRNLSPPRKNSEVLEMVNALERTQT